MLKLALLLLLIVFPSNRRHLRAVLQGVAAVWRPTAGLFAVAVMVAAAVLALREDWWMAGGLALAGAALALAARRRGPSTKATQIVSASPMSRREAATLLGVAEGAPAEAVEAAYRRLIRFAHPDRGGTAGLAAQLNAARAAMRRP